MSTKESANQTCFHQLGQSRQTRAPWCVITSGAGAVARRCLNISSKIILSQEKEINTFKCSSWPNNHFSDCWKCLECTAALMSRYSNNNDNKRWRKRPVTRFLRLRLRDSLLHDNLRDNCLFLVHRAKTTLSRCANLDVNMCTFIRPTAVSTGFSEGIFKSRKASGNTLSTRWRCCIYSGKLYYHANERTMISFQINTCRT